ncbi:MAG: SpoIID/LytB domain-containing protein [Bacteroidales bacterium]|nr:SpoIID/LytB domain-containing protein [Bacteroidales bacterium]
MRLLFLLIFSPLVILSNNNYSDFIEVNIYNGSYISEITFKVNSGSYDVYGGGNNLLSLADGDMCRVFMVNRKLSVKSGDSTYNGFTTLHFLAQGSSVFNCKPTENLRAHNYDDNLLVSLNSGALMLINKVGIEKYVAGVVQAEGGIMQDNEFFKLQAVACRTYVLRNIKRHFREGFHMCDKVHCQVYNGKCSKPEIVAMTLLTKGFVIVDKDLNFITAGFHANCGGQTVNSEDVWTLPATYMKSIVDTFCVHGRQAVWTYSVSKTRFLEYLERTYNFPVHDSVEVQKAFSFSQLNGRKVYFLDMPNIHLKNIRADFNLKSTFFTIIEDGDSLVFRGRGFGHGVGLCQEGAMEMIKQGYKYDEILKFYFTDVYIISYEDVIKSDNEEN